MKKTIGSLLALFLVLGIVSTAQAVLCTPEHCVTDPCVRVRLNASPETVCPGEIITISGTIRNLMECGDVFIVKVRYLFFDDILSERLSVVAKPKWKRPQIIIPLPAGAKFDFSYETKIPKRVPPGEYIIVMSAEGINSGVSGKAKTRFVVEDCTSSIP